MTAAGIDSWYHEKESAWLYQQVAAAEPDPAKAELFLKLAAARHRICLSAWVPIALLSADRSPP